MDSSMFPLRWRDPQGMHISVLEVYIAAGNNPRVAAKAFQFMAHEWSYLDCVELYLVAWRELFGGWEDRRLFSEQVEEMIGMKRQQYYSQPLSESF